MRTVSEFFSSFYYWCNDIMDQEVYIPLSLIVIGVIALFTDRATFVQWSIAEAVFVTIFLAGLLTRKIFVDAPLRLFDHQVDMEEKRDEERYKDRM